MKIFTLLSKYGFSGSLKKIYLRISDLFGHKWPLIPYSLKTDSGVGQEMIYAPHPFTNWSLNPGYRDAAGLKIHTKEGFRKTGEYDSIEDYFNSNKRAKKIYCFGGSTTYCTELPSGELPWPTQLQKKLNKNSVGIDSVVANAGVGGWSSLQSLIRMICWVPILKPDLIILYQSKNDLTPLYNGRSVEDKVLPDYSNLMGQFSQAVRHFSAGLGAVYGSGSSSPQDGLLRFDSRLSDVVAFRAEMICLMAKEIGTKVILMPEIINGSPYYLPMQKIHQRMHNIADQYKENVCFLDLQGVIPDDPKYFLDKMHFSAAGCELFGDILCRFIVKNELLGRRN